MKKISYWKVKFQTLDEAVTEWRKVEKVNNGFISIEDDDASKWEEFYKFIDDEELRHLHKELIRSETSSLGKFTKEIIKEEFEKLKYPREYKIIR